MLRTLAAGIRTIVLVPLFFIVTLGIALGIVLWRILRPNAPPFDRVLRTWSAWFLRIPPVRQDVTGLDLVDPSGRYIVVSNHLSMFDIPLLMASLPINGRFLAKREIFNIPIVGQAMRAIGIVEIDRKSGASSRQAVLEGIEQAATRGYSLLVFPEATRGDGNEMLRFKKGAFRMAIDSGLPLLPVVITGTDRISKPGSKLFFPGRATLHILDPIDTSSLSNKNDLTSFTNSVEASMAAKYAAATASRGRDCRNC